MKSDEAEENIEIWIELFEDSLEEGVFDGTIRVSGSGTYKKFVVTKPSRNLW